MLSRILDRLLKCRSLVLTTHIGPDGDALGSELALAYFLRGLGKRVDIINCDAPPYNLGWLPGADDIEVFSGSISQRRRLDSADAIVVLDTNAAHRLGRMSQAVQSARGSKILIDHHTHPETWFELTWVDDKASSTGEMVYDLIVAHDIDSIDADIATQLYAAIMTDTGSFRFNNVTPRVHRIVADLLEQGGIRPAPIHTAIFDTRSKGGLRLLSLALDTITLTHGDRVGYMVLTQRMLRETGTSKDEAEGFVNYVLSIEGVEAAALFSENEKGIKISFRSQGETYVHQWARHFGGGGHRNASGAYVQGTLEDVITRVMGAAPRFLGFDDEDEPADELSDEDRALLSSFTANRA
jgi:bifunctional oligoribonuclease and PAP phosphatase NrnA